MDKRCSVCNHKMMPSAIGWLCLNCGNVEKITAADKAKLPKPKPMPEESGIQAKRVKLEDIKPKKAPEAKLTENPMSSEKKETTEEPAAIEDQPIEPQKVSKEKPKIRHKVKKMFVPEVHDRKKENYLLEPGVADEQHLVEGKIHKQIHEMPSARKKKEENKPKKESLVKEEVTKPQEEINPEIPTEKPEEEVPTLENVAPKPEVKEKKHTGLNIVIVILIILIAGGAAAFLVFGENSLKFFSKNPAPTPAAEEQKPITAEQTRDQQRKKDLKDIADALNKYFADKQSYPVGTDIKVLYPLQYTNPPYITLINYDPSSTDSEKIKYGYTSDGKTYTLKAKLEAPNDPEAKDGYFVITK